MPNPMLITVPLSDEDVAAEIQTRLSPYVVRPEPKVLNLETITLIVEIMSGSADIVLAGAGTMVAVTEVIKNILEIKEKLEQEGRANEVRIGPPGSPGTLLSQADEAFLRTLLGVATSGPTTDA